MAGVFITIEGIDRSGKTTQARMLCEALGAGAAVAVREPGGTQLGEAVRGVLKDSSVEISGEAEVLLFAAARAELVREVIRPALAEGKVVVSDRFLDSSLAYQGAGRGIGPERVAAVNELATDGLSPDRTILLELDPGEAAARAGMTDRFEDEGLTLQQEVAAAYREFAAAAPERWRVVDANRDPDAVHADVRAVVDEVLASAPSAG